MKTRAWIENGVIRCCSQMCEAGSKPCPRIGFCKVVEVEIREDVVETGYEMMLKGLEITSHFLEFRTNRLTERLRGVKEMLEVYLAAVGGEDDAAQEEKRQT